MPRTARRRQDRRARDGVKLHTTLSPLAHQILFTRPAFRGLGEAERQQIAPLFGEIALPKGETIYQAGDDADALYLVVSGAVDVF